MPDLCHRDAAETNELAVGLRKLRRDQPRFCCALNPSLSPLLVSQSFTILFRRRDRRASLLCVELGGSTPRGGTNQPGELRRQPGS